MDILGNELADIDETAGMKDELDFLEELLVQYTKFTDVNSENFSLDAISKCNMIVRIAKLVRAEALNMKMRKDAGCYGIGTIAQKLLNESATAYIRGNADSAEVEIIDEVHRNVIARFKVKIAFHALMFTEIQFF